LVTVFFLSTLSFCSFFVSSSSENADVQGIYFDSRKDKTLIYEDLDGKKHRKLIVKEHISLVQEPGSKYLGPVTPERGTPLSIKESIITFIEDSDIDVENILAIGCDGTVVNTGNKGGAIRLIEEHIKRPLQWFVCLLHANELPDICSRSLMG